MFLVRLMFIIMVFSSCSISPPDVPLCTEINPSRGYCVNTISSDEFEISDTQKFEDKTWWELRPTFIYMPVESWVKIKSFIIKTCKKHGCSGQQIDSWNRTSHKIDKKIINP